MKLNFSFWSKYLQYVSLFFAAMGVFWAVAGTFDPLGMWDAQFAKQIFGQDNLSADVAKAKSFILAILGATNTGYFILQYFIAKHAYAKGQLWGYNAIMVGFLSWFIIDSSMSAYHGGYFNILLANIPCFMAMLPIFFTRKYFDQKA